MRTQDAGLTWVEEARWNNEAQISLGFVDAHTAITISDTGVMRRSDRY